MGDMCATGNMRARRASLPRGFTEPPYLRVRRPTRKRTRRARRAFGACVCAAREAPAWRSC
eukprot:5506264-Lingulodinium_polyedra.AAC.1